ncbi:hypothetical protein N7470_009647 [Penicillium chermesinum]|nr:hypothetical protein N7470_009647 [Penicillium chermesinum]
MEGVQTVDVSWLHHSQKDHLSRTKSASSNSGDNKPVNGNDTTTPSHKSHRRNRSNSSPARPPSEPREPNGSREPENGLPKIDEKPLSVDIPLPPVDTKLDPKILAASGPPPKSSPKQVNGRRNSWISTISSKFSSGSTPPSQSSLKGTPASPKATSPMDMHNPFGAAYSPGPSFLHNALRKLSSNSGGLPKIPPNVKCPRRIMNLDQDRDRCKISDLNQAKLKRVAFCVDVEIAGISHHDSDEDAPPTNQLRQSLAEHNRQKAKKAEIKDKAKEEVGAAKNTHSAVAEKEDPMPTATPTPVPTQATGPSDAPASTSPPEPETPADSKPNGEVKEISRKAEKKKRSEEERKERKERKRRQAVANGTIPLQLDAEHDEEDSRPPSPTGSRSKTQSHPTTDPVRIYRRCCQLRETPVLKRVVDEISSPSSTLAESPGTVATLDLSNFPMTLQDISTLSDWLAVVPVRKLLLESCALTDESVRAILSALLSTKTVEQMRSRRRRARRFEASVIKEERWGVVEKLSLKNNPKIGREGWRHIGLFVHLSKSLRAIDLSGIQFPKPRVVSAGSTGPTTAGSVGPDVCDTFACALAERFHGDHLEELLMSECRPSTEQIKRICEATTKMGLRRLGLANNDLTRESLEHVVKYMQDGKCEGLDLGGNALKDDLDLIIEAIEPEQPLYAISLADCGLDSSVISPLLQALARLHNLRFIDFSHNALLFTGQQSALGVFRRFLPKMPSLRRIHLADVNLSPDHVIGLAEVLPECPVLCHLNILENPQITALASAVDPAVQEEACAVYASMMAAVRVSRTIVAVDIEVPTAENNEVVKALASQIVAYSLRNLEGSAIGEEITGPLAPLADKDVVVPEILQHMVGHASGTEETVDDDDEAAPDEDYVLGGTGVVKALGVCLGNLDHLGDAGEVSAPPSGANTPRRRKSRGVVTKRPGDMSKNLLESARNIRARIQTALIREDRAGNDASYRRLQFLDMTLQRMIQRFEDEYPETRLASQPAPPSTPPDTNSQHSGEDLSAMATSANLHGSSADHENAVDDEDADNFDITLSRSSSMTSLHARAMTSEEGHVHRIGQHLRRDLLNPPASQGDGDEDDYSHILALREKLERLQDRQSQSPFESAEAERTFAELGHTVDELWAARKQDAESFERFKQSQIAAQINSGLRRATSVSNGHGPQGKNDSPDSDSPPS